MGKTKKELQAEIEDLKDQVAGMRKRQRVLGPMITREVELQETVAALSRENQRLTAERNNWRDGHVHRSGALKRCDRERHSLRADLESCQSELKDLRLRVLQQEATISEYQAREEELREDLRGRTGGHIMELYKEDIMRLRGEVAKLERDKHSVEGQLSCERQRMTEASKTIRDLQYKNDNLRGQLMDHSRSIAESATEINRLRDMLSVGTVNDLEKKIRDYEKSIKGLRNDAARRRAEFSELWSSKRELEKELEVAKANHEGVCESLVKSENEINKLKAILGYQKETIARGEAAYMNAAKESEELRQIRDEVVDENEDLKDTLVSLRDQIEVALEEDIDD